MNKRYLIMLSGTVQGVGFRPFIYQKAEEYSIGGFVCNAGATVMIDAEGEGKAIKQFMLDIVKKPPPLAAIEKVHVKNQNTVGYTSFIIQSSRPGKSEMNCVLPDIAVCAKCMEEVMAHNSRRYRYAFTTCTECGPRYSIIKSLPYDRSTTTMKPFPMCIHCKTEYQTSSSRRFHTEPNCCSDCGPSMLLLDNRGGIVECDDCIRKTAELLRQGEIIAVKGIGGFHLACDAKNEDTIKKLRYRKNRPDKPLAVMAKDLDMVRRYCELTMAEEKVLTSCRRPIVLMRRKTDCCLPEVIAPRQIRLGVMLPYAPIHFLLFEKGIEALVMTSGNIRGEPLQYDNTQAVLGLKGIADYFLIHNREIYNPVDDSVVKTVQNREWVSRRARGYIPTVRNFGVKHEILAVGAEQKSTFCISQNGYVFLSQYCGDLINVNSFVRYKKLIHHFKNLIQVSPTIWVHDLHPQYRSTHYALEQAGKKIAVQHHHAHMASCMAEHGITDDVIGIIFDGTGLGTDGTLWGGEFILGNRKQFRRVGFLKPVKLQGGDAVVKDPWRSAACYLYAMGIDGDEYLPEISPDSLDVIKQALTSNFNCHMSSGMGRLFDCVSALAGLCLTINYEAQAAIELENCARCAIQDAYEYDIEDDKGIFKLGYERILSGVLEDIKNDAMPEVIASKFHNTVIDASVDMALRLRKRYNINRIVLSGGVFENNILLEGILQTLQADGFRIYCNEQIPINDSGISVGQLVVAEEWVGD